MIKAYKIQLKPNNKQHMTYKVKYQHSGKSRERCDKVKIREGVEIYRHPKGYFVVLEFEGKSGKFREAFWPENVEKVG